jgi:ABC-type molybdate transport system substrate-binding protein
MCSLFVLFILVLLVVGCVAFSYSSKAEISEHESTPESLTIVSVG